MFLEAIYLRFAHACDLVLLLGWTCFVCLLMLPLFSHDLRTRVSLGNKCLSTFWMTLIRRLLQTGAPRQDSTQSCCAQTIATRVGVLREGLTLDDIENFDILVKRPKLEEVSGVVPKVTKPTAQEKKAAQRNGLVPVARVNQVCLHVTWVDF